MANRIPTESTPSTVLKSRWAIPTLTIHNYDVRDLVQLIPERLCGHDPLEDARSSKKLVLSR